MKRQSLYLAVSLLSAGAALAEQGGVRPYLLPADLEAYFKSRYGQVERVVSRLEATADGPHGTLRIVGRLLPRVVAPGETPKDRARGVARGFLEQEAALLDIPDFEEIRETDLRMADDGTASVHYTRSIGPLELPDANYRIDVEPIGAIRLVSVSLVPVGSELYRAVNRPTITEDEVRASVLRDLAKPDESAPIVSAIRKIATWREPYVLWTASGSRGRKPAWSYAFDAFSGKLLRKTCSQSESLVPLPDGRTLCD